eukprot:Em0010g4a
MPRVVWERQRQKLRLGEDCDRQMDTIPFLSLYAFPGGLLVLLHKDPEVHSLPMSRCDLCPLEPQRAGRSLSSLPVMTPNHRYTHTYFVIVELVMPSLAYGIRRQRGLLT